MPTRRTRAARPRSYSELHALSTFADRFRYLSLNGRVGDPTFGSERYVNQHFYRSREWKRARDEVIVRDGGCDLGIDGFEIYDRIYIHHMNPMTVEEIADGDDRILDPEYLICVTHRTHNAIHYGDESQIPRQFEERRPGDTKLW
jgi:hypothetical protein